MFHSFKHRVVSVFRAQYNYVGTVCTLWIFGKFVAWENPVWGL